jgi:hypothetical protein
MSRLLRRIIESDITVPTYLFILSSLVLGLIGLRGAFQPEVAGSPFASRLVLDLLPWSLILTIGNLLVLTGVIIRSRLSVQVGAMLAFCMWVFGSISFSLTGQFATFLVVTLPYLIFFAYIYLAAFFRKFN